MHLDTESGELGGDDFGGAFLFEGGFRMGVNIMPPLGHFLVEFGNPVDDRHGVSFSPVSSQLRLRNKFTRMGWSK